MRPFRSTSRRPSSYVCLSCRLQSTRYNTELSNGIGLQSLQEDDVDRPSTREAEETDSHLQADGSSGSSRAPVKTYTYHSSFVTKHLAQESVPQRQLRKRVPTPGSSSYGSNGAIRLSTRNRDVLTTITKHHMSPIRLQGKLGQDPDDPWKVASADVPGRSESYDCSAKQSREDLVLLRSREYKLRKQYAISSRERTRKDNERWRSERLDRLIESHRSMSEDAAKEEAVGEVQSKPEKTAESNEGLEAVSKKTAGAQQRMRQHLWDWWQKEKNSPKNYEAVAASQDKMSDDALPSKSEAAQASQSYKPFHQEVSALGHGGQESLVDKSHVAKSIEVQKAQDREVLAASEDDSISGEAITVTEEKEPEESLEDILSRHRTLAQPPTPSEIEPTPSVSPTLRERTLSAQTRRWSLNSHYPPPVSGRLSQTRLLHTSSKHRQQAAAGPQQDHFQPSSPPPLFYKNVNLNSPIRTQLRQWQELHGDKEDPTDRFFKDQDIDLSGNDSVNNLTRLPTDDSTFQHNDLKEEEEREAMSHFMCGPTRDMDSAPVDTRWLKTGDLVELEFPRSERESLIAVFVRRLGQESQLFTMQGRWVHLPERQIPYNISGWIAPELIEPLLPYLPDPQSIEEKEKLNEDAYIHDLSVPREIASGLVSRMVQFSNESQEIYRKHAGTLDNAHEILAHDTDLRYGSLLSAAVTLLKTPADKLPVTALFTVRKALARAGFAFNIDRRSHRLTGYLQIRSKEQVRMVDEVRGWLREWQDDMALRSALSAVVTEGNLRKLSRHRTPPKAQYVYDFIERAKKIVMESRKDRDPTPYGNVGPSKKRFPITPDSEAIRVKSDLQFTREDQEIVRFVEAWACSGMFLGLPRIEALPPLILHATGLYTEMDVRIDTGYMFLQELGTIMPYENRVRFDQHLLLPSSQHSKPLSKLMDNLMNMRDNHQFHDTMKDLRKDWGNLPVYCIDDATAHEIDDGISIEKAGEGEWWVHIHIANPTAFFERDHPLAKMARHMGESIYMPERTYMMLPRWATSRHFSLAKDRPCLSFSARMNSEGETLERKIQSGKVTNVVSLTSGEVSELLGSKRSKGSELVLTVGGEPPPPRGRKSMLDSVTKEQVEELKLLQELAGKRADVRRKNGGIFFDMHQPDAQVWQSWRSSGLAWDHPYRRGSRTVEGDPVIQFKTSGMTNYFAPNNDVVDVMVREMMLLACETAAAWCAERQIPVIFRGILRRPESDDPNRFLQEVLIPATKDTSDGAYPLHLGIQYMQMIGNTALSSRPFKHTVLGMDYYGKVTSPLRRYGDMIIHWQIEAAIREEARTGRSLVTQDFKADRNFLPFSSSVLDTIMLGLQPRESIVQRAKNYALHFWTSMMLFRAIHFNETEVPFYTENSPNLSDGTPKPYMRAFVHSNQSTQFWAVNATSVDLNYPMALLRPDRLGLGEARQGDIWEVKVDHIDVYKRGLVCEPVRLVKRVTDEQLGLSGQKSMTQILAGRTSMFRWSGAAKPTS